MWLPKVYVKTLMASGFLQILAGCIASGSGGWPVDTYASTCQRRTMPTAPICLSSAEYDGGFKYSDQFQACHQSMKNFINALNEYYDCSDVELKQIFNKLLVSVPDTYNCYVEFFKEKKEGDPSAACPPIDVPRYLHSYEADGLEYDLGVPRCIRKSDGYNFSPKWSYQLDDCLRQVEIFSGKNLSSRSMNASSAQDQYDGYLQNLRRVLDQKADDAVRKFKCLAERQRYCI